MRFIYTFGMNILTAHLKRLKTRISDLLVADRRQVSTVYIYIIFGNEVNMAQRTGLRTLQMIVKRICELFSKFYPAMVAIVPPEKIVYFDALLQACQDFDKNVDVSAILGDES